MQADLVHKRQADRGTGRNAGRLTTPEASRNGSRKECRQTDYTRGNQKGRHAGRRSGGHIKKGRCREENVQADVYNMKISAHKRCCFVYKTVLELHILYALPCMTHTL